MDCSGAGRALLAQQAPSGCRSWSVQRLTALVALVDHSCREASDARRAWAVGSRPAFWTCRLGCFRRSGPVRDHRSRTASATTATHCRPTRILGRHQLRVAHRVSSVSTRPWPRFVDRVVRPSRSAAPYGLGYGWDCDDCAKGFAGRWQLTPRWPAGSHRVSDGACWSARHQSYCERAAARGCPRNR